MVVPRFHADKPYASLSCMDVPSPIRSTTAPDLTSLMRQEGYVECVLPTPIHLANTTAVVILDVHHCPTPLPLSFLPRTLPDSSNIDTSPSLSQDNLHPVASEELVRSRIFSCILCCSRERNERHYMRSRLARLLQDLIELFATSVGLQLHSACDAMLVLLRWMLAIAFSF